jgi:hypothetical protein
MMKGPPTDSLAICVQYANKILLIPWLQVRRFCKQRLLIQEPLLRALACVSHSPRTATGWLWILRLVNPIQMNRDASWLSFSQTVHHTGHEVNAPWRSTWNQYF